MHGVIIWSDKAQGRAVIWCEDHGDLAFFGGDTQSADKTNRLEPGDLVYFDLQVENALRLALNLRLVAADEFPTLMRDLKEIGHEIAAATESKLNLRHMPPSAGSASQRL
jgi:hypothetical protein